MSFIEFVEYWCKIDELGKLWAVKTGFIEEVYIHLVDLRGFDAGHEFL